MEVSKPPRKFKEVTFMVVAGEKHLDKFAWGEAEQFHTVEQDDKRFWLFEDVTITTKHGYQISGEIGNITETSVHILPQHRPAQIIKFADIKDINY